MPILSNRLVRWLLCFQLVQWVQLIPMAPVHPMHQNFLVIPPNQINFARTVQRDQLVLLVRWNRLVLEVLLPHRDQLDPEDRMVQLDQILQ